MPSACTGYRLGCGLASSRHAARSAARFHNLRCTLRIQSSLPLSPLWPLPTFGSAAFIQFWVVSGDCSGGGGAPNSSLALVPGPRFAALVLLVLRSPPAGDAVLVSSSAAPSPSDRPTSSGFGWPRGGCSGGAALRIHCRRSFQLPALPHSSFRCSQSPPAGDAVLVAASAAPPPSDVWGGLGRMFQRRGRSEFVVGTRSSSPLRRCRRSEAGRPQGASGSRLGLVLVVSCWEVVGGGGGKLGTGGSAPLSSSS